jgi:hypothetical protein
MEVRFGEKLKAAPKHDLGGEPGTDGPLFGGIAEIMRSSRYHIPMSRQQHYLLALLAVVTVTDRFRQVNSSGLLSQQIDRATIMHTAHVLTYNQAVYL